MQYYKPTAVVELLNLFPADNQATHLESSWEYKLDRYTSLPSGVLGPFQTSCYCRAELDWSN